MLLDSIKLVVVLVLVILGPGDAVSGSKKVCEN